MQWVCLYVCTCSVAVTTAACELYIWLQLHRQLARRPSVCTRIASRVASSLLMWILVLGSGQLNWITCFTCLPAELWLAMKQQVSKCWHACHSNGLFYLWKLIWNHCMYVRSWAWELKLNGPCCPQCGWECMPTVACSPLSLKALACIQNWF